jgi:hypothetical protein
MKLPDSMLPKDLTAGQFNHYPPQARNLAQQHLVLFQQLPLAFLPLLLREVIGYDWKFPAERKEIDNQFTYLTPLTPEQLQKEFADFTKLRLSPDLEEIDWVNMPAQFSERLSAHLWATHQIDAFRAASVEYIRQVNTAVLHPALPINRLGLVTVGRGVTENRRPLFRKLRGEGVYFKNVNPQGGREALFETLQKRAGAQPVAFGHWYIDGSKNEVTGDGLTCLSFSALDGVRRALVAKMRQTMQPGGGGPEVLRTLLAQMKPEELGLGGEGNDAILNRFRVSVLTEGSGTQLFSTTFVQWSAREVLRRAQPLTLLTRYAPRQREQSMRELLAGTQSKPELDPVGALIDADMGAYYTWLNQQRLPGAEQAGFLVWFEDHHEAVAIGPALKRGAEESGPVTVREILSRII